MTTPKVKHFSYRAGKKYDGMMGRCYRPNDTSFSNYGGRGIRVCSAWIKSIESFRCWLREELIRLEVSEEDFVNNSGKYQLDRIDSASHYSPENCRIVNPQTNSRNVRSRNKIVIQSAEGESIEI